MDDKQAKLDEELALVIAEATQSRVSMTEAIVLIRKMEAAGWSFTNKAAEDEAKRKADEEKKKLDDAVAAERILAAKEAKATADAKAQAAAQKPMSTSLGMPSERLDTHSDVTAGMSSVGDFVTVPKDKP